MQDDEPMVASGMTPEVTEVVAAVPAESPVRRRTRRKAIPALVEPAHRVEGGVVTETRQESDQPANEGDASVLASDRPAQPTLEQAIPVASAEPVDQHGDRFAQRDGDSHPEVDEAPADSDAERTPGRRRRSRRGRRPEVREEGDVASGATSDVPAFGGDADDVPPSHADPAPAATEHSVPVPPFTPELAAEAATRDDSPAATEPPAYRPNGSRRNGLDHPAAGDGYDSRSAAPYDRANRDGRNRRDWREQSDPREHRDGQRSAPRDRQMPGRDRALPPRDGRQNANLGRDPNRDGQAFREAGRDNGSYREPAGYREGAPRETSMRDRNGEVAAPSRPAEVVTRGYVVAMDQNQNQWQLRTHGHLPSPQDATIALSVIRSNGLRAGDEVVGLVRGAAAGRRYGELLDVQSINGVPAERLLQRPRFDDLTPIYPDRHMRMERAESVTARLIDIVCPIGFGQRAMIVSPPKAGKTTILKEIGRSININYPEVKLIVCLVGERPEEVTDLAKSLHGEVISSTFDEAINHHTELAEITIERARRLVESGFDVVVLLDSVTRLARAYNLSAPGDSRSLSGGMATTALYPPKRFFGAARALQEGGSLTVIATCLVDTNSRLDDVIYEELKGTGNMELVLDRRLAEERVFPAIDIVKSSTRREELLLQPNELTAVMRLRRALAMGNDQVNNTQRIIQQMERTHTNAEFLASLLSQSSAR